MTKTHECYHARDKLKQAFRWLQVSVPTIFCHKYILQEALHCKVTKLHSVIEDGVLYSGLPGNVVCRSSC